MKEKKQNQNTLSIKSIIIIISYFILPYLVSFITDLKVVNSVIYIIYAILLIFMYRETFKFDFKDLTKNYKKYIKIMFINIVLIFVSMIVINAIVQGLFSVTETSENDFSLLNTFKENPGIIIVLTGLYYPLVEGIIFRKAIRDVIDSKWLFIIFSSLFYFFFNIVYTSMSFNNIMPSLCYISTMLIVSHTYWKTNNFTLSVIIMSLFNIVVSLLSFI